LQSCGAGRLLQATSAWVIFRHIPQLRVKAHYTWQLSPYRRSFSPMATYKITLQMNFEKQGWSESWYATTSDVEALKTQAQSIAVLRVACLPEKAYMQSWKLSDEGILGDSFANFDIQFQPPTTLAGDQAGTGLLCRVGSGTLYRRELIVRCLPDAWVFRNSSGQITWATAADTAVKAYLDAVIAAQWQLRVITKVGDGSTDFPVSQFEAGAITGTTNVHAPGFPGTASTDVGKTVQIRGSKGDAKASNGKWQITGASAAGEVLINLPFADIARYLPLDIAKTRIRFVTIKYVNVTSRSIEDVRNKKPGRAFFVPAGRRRV
jgi:hypothetical protein